MLANMSIEDQYTGMTRTQRHHSPRFTFISHSAGGPWPVTLGKTISPSPSSCPLPPTKDSESLPLASSPSIYVTNGSTMETSTSIVTITPATPPKEDADSPLIHGKRQRRNEVTPNPNTLYPPEFSAPIPKSPSSRAQTATVIRPSQYSDTHRTLESPRSPLLYTPGMPLRFSIDSLKIASNRNSNGPQGPSFQASNSTSAPSRSSSTSPASTYSMGNSQSRPSVQPPLIRKKSGQLVRSSLKSSPSYSRSGFGLNISSPIPSFPSSKSEPSTPTASMTSKLVHFDESLDQVKLFLAGQKPLAVSREGSQVDTDECETATSGTECEIPKTRSSSSTTDGDKKWTKLVMHTNIPPRSVPFPPSGRNVVLQSLTISSDEKSVIGSILVRNIAFEKRVSARFSLDGWFTISEVTAKWEGGALIGRDGKTEWDRFGFDVWLGDLRLGEQDTRLELAILYRVENRRDVWDNNDGGNYVATFSKLKLPDERGKGRKTHQRRKPDPVPFSDDELSDFLVNVISKKSESRSITSPSAKMKSKTSKSSSSVSNTTTQYPSGPSHTRTQSFPFSTSSAHSPITSAQRWMEVSPSPPSKGLQHTRVAGGTVGRYQKPTPTPATSRFGSDRIQLNSGGFRIEELITTALDSETPVLSPSGNGELSPDSTSTLLSTPTSSRSSTPPLEMGQDVGPLSPSLSKESEIYSELLEKFCFFTGSGSPRAQPGRAATI